MVQSAATRTAHLWRDAGLDGDRAARLIEVSHALQRAALALSDVDLIGHVNRARFGKVLVRSAKGRTCPEADRAAEAEHVRKIERFTDRERIATDMHRTIVHQVLQAGMAMQGALPLVSDPVAAERIQDAAELLNETLRTICTVVLHLSGADVAAQ